MNPPKVLKLICVVTLITLTVTSFSSGQQKTVVCKQATFAAWKPMPALRYPCKGLENEWDEKKILKLSSRLQAKRVLRAQLASITSNNWWQAAPEDLSACDVRRKPGTLTSDQKEYLDYNYRVWLLGNDRTRLVAIPDPCFQTEYNGSIIFILTRQNGRVVVTEAMGGYFSRADNSLGIDFASLNGAEVVELATGSGGLNPSLTNYYFVIERTTGKAIPLKIFPGEHGLSNEIRSALLMSDPEAVDLPADAETLKVIKDHRLVNSVSIYAEDEDGPIDDNGRKLKRTVLQWNGKVYK